MLGRHWIVTVATVVPDKLLKVDARCCEIGVSTNNICYVINKMPMPLSLIRQSSRVTPWTPERLWMLIKQRYLHPHRAAGTPVASQLIDIPDFVSSLLLF